MKMLPSVFGENLFDTFFDTDFDRMMNSAFPRVPSSYGKRAQTIMKTDVRETEENYILDVDLPGFKKDEISVQLEKGYLTISATKKSSGDEKDANGSYIRRERFEGACSRSFFVGENVKKENISAKLEDGILRLTFPKKLPQEIEESRTIAIE